MKVQYVSLVLASLVTLASLEEYSDKYDTLNLDEILSNQRLLKGYINCLKGVGKCTPEGLYLKSHIADGLQTGCSKCSARQREGVTKVIRHMVHHAPKQWDELVAIYDPHGEYSHKYRDMMGLD